MSELQYCPLWSVTSTRGGCRCAAAAVGRHRGLSVLGPRGHLDVNRGRACSVVGSNACKLGTSALEGALERGRRVHPLHLFHGRLDNRLHAKEMVMSNDSASRPQHTTVALETVRQPTRPRRRPRRRHWRRFRHEAAAGAASGAASHQRHMPPRPALFNGLRVGHRSRRPQRRLWRRPQRGAAAGAAAGAL